jgi:hypothetical protein
MKSKIVFFVICLFLFANAYAQNNIFKVLGVKGYVTINNVPVKVGSQIATNQIIKISGSSAYLNLSHNSLKKVIELTQAGTYKAQELEKQLKSSNESLEEKYYKWAVEEITKSKDDKIASRNRFQHMNKTGSVERGNYLLMTNLWKDKEKNKIEVLGEKLFVRWMLRDSMEIKPAQIASYKILFYDLNEDLLFEQIVKDANAEIDLKNAKLAQADILMMKIVPLGKNGEYLKSINQIDGEAIIKVDINKQRLVNAELEKIRKSKSTNTAFGKLMEARIFEEQELYVDAMTAYEQALKMSSEADSYLKLYNYFLERLPESNKNK